MSKIVLNVQRFKQKPSECGIAAVSSIAKFYDDDIDYKEVRKLLPHKNRDQGLYTSQQARLLNELGFYSVSIVTADQNLVDFSWSKLSQNQIIGKLKKVSSYYGKARRYDDQDYANNLIDWLEDKNYDNKIIIDNDYPKYIRRSINYGRPVGASINWTTAFHYSKGGGDIKGDEEHHAIVVRGYDEKGVFLVDSHHQKYRGRLKKYNNGYYKWSWNKFLTNIGQGDLILTH